MNTVYPAQEVPPDPNTSLTGSVEIMTNEELEQRYSKWRDFTPEQVCQGLYWLDQVREVLSRVGSTPVPEIAVLDQSREPLGTSCTTTQLTLF